MKAVTFTDLRNHATKYFDEVEDGEILEVFRNGKPIAILTPYRPGKRQRWKQNIAMSLPDVSLSQSILDERNE